VGPLEKEIAELLNESIRDTPIGLAARVQGPDAVRETLLNMTGEQHALLAVQVTSGLAMAIRRIAREFDSRQST
jgi:hypothetical protein